MKNAIKLLSITCVFLLVHIFFTTEKANRQAKEIKTLERTVDSLKFAKYLDSLFVSAERLGIKVIKF